MKLITNISLISFLCLVMFSCDTTEPDDKKIDLNPKLHSVFYWGIKDPTTLIPNTGVSVGPPILYPTWVGNNKIFFYSSELKNNKNKKGIFEIEINPKDYSLVNNEYHLYEYEYNIFDMSYITSTGEFLLMVYKNGGSTAVVVQLEGNYVIEKETLVDNNWKVEGITIWNERKGFVFYGRNPQNNISGFYSLIKNFNGNYQKELIYSIEDSGLDKLNFITTYDGNNLFFGLNKGSVNSYGTMQLLKLSLTQETAMPEVIFERKGGYIYVTQNSINQELFLINYSYRGDSSVSPQGHIELFNSVTLRSIDLNVRTIRSKYYLIINEHPSWSPNGNHFAFSAGGFTGERDTYYPDLWIYENVP